MRRIKSGNRMQLVLDLEREGPKPPIAPGSKVLLETLADLLLEALGGSQQLVQPLEIGGVDERQDHA